MRKPNNVPKRQILLFGIAAAVAVAVLAGLAVYDFRPLPAPYVDARLRAEITPVIRDHLEKRNSTDALLAQAAPELKPRSFCDVRVIETRRRGADLLVGVNAECGEFARRGGALLSGTAEWGASLVTLRPARTAGTSGAGSVGGTAGANGTAVANGTTGAMGTAWAVVQVEDPGLGADGPPSLERMFTDAGRAELERIADDRPAARTEQLADRARRAFGLPPDAPVVQP